MARLPSVSWRQVVKALSKAGFYLDHQRGSHMTYRRDEPPAKVIVPRHLTLDRGTLGAIVRQGGLSAEEFLQLLRDP